MNKKYTLTEIAFAGLLHDIGKFYQRTMKKSDLSDDEESVTPISKKGGFHTHLHAGYTSRFFRQYLHLNNDYEWLVSTHHLHEDNEYSLILKKADQLASRIDRKDERADYMKNNEKGGFIKARMSSVLGEVDFGKQKEKTIFDIEKISDSDKLQDQLTDSLEQSVEKYKQLFMAFTTEVGKDSIEINARGFNRMFSLMKEFTTKIPASTYESSTSSVSLFDHSRLTAAIASCLYYKNDGNDDYRMIEFDVSGIQKFIFKVVEGADKRPKVAKALRGRSLYISLITSYIACSYLHAFQLTMANLIFNTGGGAVLLVPNSKESKQIIEDVSKQLRMDLFRVFKMDITFVYASIILNDKQLETFKIEKALELKALLEENKTHKYADTLCDSSEIHSNCEIRLCKMCGTIINNQTNDECTMCKAIENLSTKYIHNDRFVIAYDFNTNIEDDDTITTFTNGRIQFYSNGNESVYHNMSYLESYNYLHLGDYKFIANLAPKINDTLLNLEEISSKLLQNDMGDNKLGILKMDVDNLGAIFAFGLKQAEDSSIQGVRSLSKYVTLSRLLEKFFTLDLVRICKEVSLEMNPNIAELSDNTSMFYINYAGGDDLVILGPAKAIIYLGLKIYQRFQKFTNNQNITISGGVHIQNAKKPVRFGIQEAEKQLELSKQRYDKNGFTILNTVLAFHDVETMLSEVDMFVGFMQKKVLSRSILYSLMNILDDKDYQQFITYVPRVLYTLTRNIDGHKFDRKRKQLFKKIQMISNDEDVKQFVLQLKLAMMFTRGGKNE